MDDTTIQRNNKIQKSCIVMSLFRRFVKKGLTFQQVFQALLLQQGALLAF